MRTVLSPDPDTTREPSGENATEYTEISEVRDLEQSSSVDPADQTEQNAESHRDQMQSNLNAKTAARNAAHDAEVAASPRRRPAR